MTVTVGHLANLVRGNVLGDGEVVIHAARALKDAILGDITVIDANQEAQLQQSNACAAVADLRQVPHPDRRSPPRFRRHHQAPPGNTYV